ncbi:MAG TPA: hypothetical protein VK904_00910, partial [Miltoncostaeaceae bacterium]|nr:hypothetical protein [Miltoncostaeaceae bacterium]
MAIETAAARGGAVGLDAHGIEPQGTVWWNLPVAALYERALSSGEGELPQPAVGICRDARWQASRLSRRSGLTHRPGQA